jgi:biopolymer transport protein ExbD
MKIRHVREEEKISLQMTPMIDIVFQLLIFFIMTFKIVSLEGDFNIKMPTSAPSEGAPDMDALPPMKLRLTSNDTGQIASIVLNERKFESFDQLHQHILSLLGEETGPGNPLEGAEVEMDCDYGLRYEYVIAAISAVSGERLDKENIVKLIEKIKFSPPRKPPETD